MKFDNSFLAYYNLKKTFYASYYMPLDYTLKGDESNVDKEYLVTYILHS